MPYNAPEYHPAFEEYCETIFELMEDDFEVIQARIAERLEVSRPAVSEMIHRLEESGLVEASEGSIKLSINGRSESYQSFLSKVLTKKENNLDFSQKTRRLLGYLKRPTNLQSLTTTKTVSSTST